MKISKKKLIISVGRFHPLKKQDVLIHSFINGKFDNYELVMAGGLLPADSQYIQQLKQMATGHHIRILENSSYMQIEKLYNEATIFWHGAGFGETNPEHMEHFGITVVEAMSLGAVPIVFNGGGLPEIVKENICGYLWNDENELIDKTNKLITSQNIMQSVSQGAVKQSAKFSEEKFTSAFDTLLSNITQ